MDLYIKTQQEGCIVKVDTIAHEKDGGVYANEQPYSIKYRFEWVKRFDRFILGKYSSEARAIEVVKTIWDKLRLAIDTDGASAVYFEMPRE